MSMGSSVLMRRIEGTSVVVKECCVETQRIAIDSNVIGTALC